MAGAESRGVAVANPEGSMASCLKRIMRTLALMQTHKEAMAVAVTEKLLFLSDRVSERPENQKVLAAIAVEDLVCCRDQGKCELRAVSYIQKNHGDATASNCSISSGISFAFQFFPPIICLSNRW